MNEPMVQVVTENGETKLLCDGHLVASWEPFLVQPQALDAIKLAYRRGRRDQQADTAKTLREIFGLKG